MTVLVTGASGFAGGAIVSALTAAGVPVRAMVRDPARYTAPAGAEVVVAELRDRAAVDRAVAGVDTVVHAAAHLAEFGSAATFHEVNVAGTERLLAAAAAAGARRLVFVSSPSALMAPSGGDQLTIDESVPYPDRFLNRYCETKARAEQLVLAANTAEFTTCALRPRAIWGPGDRRGPLIRIMAKLRQGSLPDLSGGRTVLASLCYIDHLTRAVELALHAESVGGRAYFVADAEPVALWETLAEVSGRFGLTPPTRTVPAPVLRAAVAAIDTVWRIPAVGNRWEPPLSRYGVALVTRSATYDTTAARRDLGWAPTVSFDEGLARFSRWIDDLGGLDTLLEGLR
ncbi:NAD-dependent epimerase/dehydratase family protein [Nocardia stercoris]|uniref:NAD-dependent epimerase/dehydratase family protein n=1 Tax=Nocardia stercoris TaxID=2483361 RepID=A0A3M2LCS5_9NOCA|nr:NAD-dependent epimerase/dehydratase family protein [Nocardia stercoris]RMI35347.1 NAD-dependent epimerase/dehydratase family protein [Nocardia stercoris]